MLGGERRDRDAYTLSNGASARFASARDPLADHKLLAVAQVGGTGTGARNDAIRLATPLSFPVLERHLPELITATEVPPALPASSALILDPLHTNVLRSRQCVRITK